MIIHDPSGSLAKKNRMLATRCIKKSWELLCYVDQSETRPAGGQPAELLTTRTIEEKIYVYRLAPFDRQEGPIDGL